MLFEVRSIGMPCHVIEWQYASDGLATFELHDFSDSRETGT
jgi:hypothetical protein